MLQKYKELLKRLAETAGIQLAGRGRVGIDFWHDLRRLDLKPSLIFDVGANVGQWAEECRRQLPDAAIHSFEPEPTAYRSLTKKFRRDPLHTSHRAAISHTPGHSSLRISTFETMHSLEPSFENRQLGTLEVETCTIDQIVHSLDVKTIALLKIDAEGHEMACLAGASSALEASRIDAILLEVGFAGGYHTKFCSVEEYLYPFGLHLFSFYDIVPRDKKPEVYYANALFIREGISLR